MHSRWLSTLLSSALLLIALHAGAAPAQTDAELDARVQALSSQLRCLVCQNQTLADSNADLAVDLRREIRAQMAQGASDDAIKTYLVQRYGDFVLYKPPFKPLTWLLWLGPFIVLAAVLFWLWRTRQRTRQGTMAAADAMPEPEREALPTVRGRSMLTNAMLLTLLPPLAVALYLHLGSPVALFGTAGAHDGPDGETNLTAARVEDMVDRLAERLRKNPDDANGWVMLARSYVVLERYDDAAAAFDRAIALAPDVAPLRSDYADVLASIGGGSLEGPAMAQIQAALRLDPDDPKGLALAASAAAERGDKAQAIAYWEHLYRLLPPDSQIAGRIAANLAAARAATGAAGATTGATSGAATGAAIAAAPHQ